MSKILALTGLTGKSGGVLAEQIAEKIAEVDMMFPAGIRAFVRISSNTAKIDRLIPNIQKCVGDIADVRYLRANLEGVDTLVHIAGISTSSAIIEAAKLCDVRRIILVHTSGIYSKYKSASEWYRQIDSFVYNACKENGIILTILRPTMIYGNTKDGNVVTFIKMADKLPLIPVVSGAKFGLQPVNYMDLGKAYYQVLMHEDTTANRDFILSGGEPILLRKIFEVIGENLHKKVRFVSCPFWLAYVGAWLIYMLTFKKKDYREKVQRLCEPRVFSHADAAIAFGYNPLNFEEGIVNEVIEYREKSK